MNRVLKLHELADYLRVSYSTVYRLAQKGLIPGFKIGSEWRFNLESIEQWRLTTERGSASPPHTERRSSSR